MPLNLEFSKVVDFWLILAMYFLATFETCAVFKCQAICTKAKTTYTDNYLNGQFQRDVLFQSRRS